MPAPPPPGTTHGVVAPVRTDPLGKAGPTRRQVDGAEWRRCSRGLFVPAYVEQTTPQRIVEVAARLGAGSAVTGWGALAWRGAAWFDGLDDRGAERPVPVAGPAHRMRSGAELTWSSERLDPTEVDVVDGVAVTGPVAAVLFEMRHAATVTAAVQALDLAACSDLVSIAEAIAWTEGHQGWRGVGHARQACGLADENCWSPTESITRGRWRREHPQAVLLCNRPVFDLGGHHQLTPDLLDERAGVAVEYEGRVHLTTANRHRDVVREARYRDLELEVVVVTAPDRAAPQAFLRRLDAAYARAGRRPSADRRWTTTQPSWWLPTHTVEARRALTAAQRRRLLRARSA